MEPKDASWARRALDAAALAKREALQGPAPKWSEAEIQVSTAMILAALRRRDLAALDQAERDFGGVPLQASKAKEFNHALWEAAGDPQGFGFGALTEKMRQQALREGGSIEVGKWLREGLLGEKEPSYSLGSVAQSTCVPLMACFDRDNVAALGEILQNPQWLEALAALEPRPWASESDAKHPLRLCLAWQAAIHGAPRCAAFLCKIEPFSHALLPWAYEPERSRWEGLRPLQSQEAPSKAGLFEKVVASSVQSNGAVLSNWLDAAWSMLEYAPKDQGPLAGPGCPVGWADLLIAGSGLEHLVHRQSLMMSVLAKHPKMFSNAGSVFEEGPHERQLKELAARCSKLGVDPDWDRQAKAFASHRPLSDWFALQGQAAKAGSKSTARL